MSIDEIIIEHKGIRFEVTVSGNRAGRSFLYLMYNDLHERPFGFIEDVFVEEEFRGSGLGKELVKKMIDKASEVGCYKLILTSRYSKPKVHDFYSRLGFSDHGKEFRINF